MRRLPRIALLAAGLSLGCVPACASKDAVSISGSIAEPRVVVVQGSLVTTIEGGFDVFLELGARASGGTDVTFSEFSLVRASDGTPVLAKEKLSVVSSATGPVHLSPGDKSTVQFEIGDVRNGATVPAEIDQGDHATVCGAGELRITGTMLDTSSGAGSTPLSSAPFLPSGC